MRVILKEDIGPLGHKGSVVNVADGYARNYLIPKGLAEPATPSNLKRLESERRDYQRRMARLKGEAEKLAKDLKGITCSFSMKAGEDGRLFGAVTSIDIEGYLKEKGFSIDKKQILLSEPIKQTGTYEVPVRLHPQVSVNLRVEVRGVA